MPNLLIWLNGPFGVGKTTVAARLAQRLEGFREFDAETVGTMLRSNLSDVAVQDFQDWSAWRSLVADSVRHLTRQTGADLIVPQTVLKPQYWNEISAAIASAPIRIFHVVLDASEAALRARITASDDAREWRLQHIAEYSRARSEWMADRADRLIDTTDMTPGEVAESIATSVGKE